MKTTTLGLGNNEQLSAGIFPQADGTFLAMTFTRSKTFKTLAGAARWVPMIARCQVNPAGPWFGPRDGLHLERCPTHHTAIDGAETSARAWGVRLWPACARRGSK